MAADFTTNWQRFCTVTLHDAPSQYHFLDLGDYGSNTVFEYTGMQLNEVGGANAAPEPHSIGRKAWKC